MDPSDRIEEKHRLSNPSMSPFHDGVEESLPHYYRSILKRFQKISRAFVRFNLFASALLFTEVLSFILFLPFLSKSAILAFALGGLFLTCFSYIVLLFYFQAKKPEQLFELKEQFLQSCRQLFPSPPGTIQHHLSIADAFSKLSHYLHDFETQLYQAPSALSFLSPTLSRFSSLCFRGDVFKMKQLLLLTSISEHLQQIRATPTDLEVHASLANNYVALSKLYKNGSQSMKPKETPWEIKAQGYSKLAIEEFKILNHYAPNDPWVHEQLALGFRDLGLYEEEIREVELISKLRPQDKEILFQLGSLYFHQGMNAKGLQIYEQLKKVRYEKAETLIAHYGNIPA